MLSTSQLMSKIITLFLCGDVMTGTVIVYIILGRGIDQIQKYRCDPTIYEGYVQSANGYVWLAEQVNGPIPRSVDPNYIWGDALTVFDEVKPDVKIINLETSVTTSEDYEPKGINYRMHPNNINCISAANINCCVLANNHILDWGIPGLIETLDTIRNANIQTVGVGKNIDEADTPAILDVNNKGRVIVYAVGTDSSGVHRGWSATSSRPGVNYIGDLTINSAARIGRRIKTFRRPNDVTVFSIHWGSNWGYQIRSFEREFAHALIDSGIDIVYGHSSHHAKGIEVYNHKLILYGCGDFINDYEGISGYEEFRDDLAIMYFPSVDVSNGELISLRLVPLQIKKFSLHKPVYNDVKWICDVLNEQGKDMNTHFKIVHNDTLVLDKFV